MVFWNSCGVQLPAAKKCDSQGKSLVKNEMGYLFKGSTDLEYKFLLLSHAPFKNAQKQIALPPSAKPGQFQNPPLSGTVFQKSRSLQHNIPGHSSAPSTSHAIEIACLYAIGQAGPCSIASSVPVFCRQTCRQTSQPRGSLLSRPHI